MALVIPIFISHHGCPHRCLFCNQEAIAGKDQASNRAPAVAEEIDTWLARSPQASEVEVAFYGGSFTCLPASQQRMLLAAVKPYIQAGRVGSVRLSTRPDCVHQETVEFLQEHGVATVELGVQSLTDSVLVASQRGHSAGDSRKAVNILLKGGLRTGIQLLPGLPGESTSSFLNTVKEVGELQPAFVRLYPAVVIEHSGLAKLYRQRNYIPLTLNKAVALVRRATELLEQASVPVARMGLQPSESLAAKVVAGPYHPAFGELVKSRSWFRRIRARLHALEPNQKLTVHISHRDQSAVIGMKQMNLRRLQQLGYGQRFEIVVEQERKRQSIAYVVSQST